MKTITLVKKQSMLLLIIILLTAQSSAYARSVFSYTTLLQQLPSYHLAPHVFQLALDAYQKAKQQGLVQKPIVTVIDYSQPSTAKRLWVIDLLHKKVLFNTWVAHGKNSGDNLAEHFSNKLNSLASSLGVFVTGHTYSGHHGYSLTLRGLEPGINNNVTERHVVFHAAKYVNSQLIHLQGRIGRSWGCPALNPKVAPKIINAIKGGSLVFAYYPDQHWLKNSCYLPHPA